MEQMEQLQSATAAQLESLRTAVMASLPNKPSTEPLEQVQIMKEMHPDSRLSGMMEELCHQTEEMGVHGLVTDLGVYQSGGRQSNWIRNAVPADELLSLIESGVAGKVLACIGNANRLAIKCKASSCCWRASAIWWTRLTPRGPGRPRGELKEER